MAKTIRIDRRASTGKLEITERVIGPDDNFAWDKESPDGRFVVRMNSWTVHFRDTEKSEDALAQLTKALIEEEYKEIALRKARIAEYQNLHKQLM